MSWTLYEEKLAIAGPPHWWWIPVLAGLVIVLAVSCISLLLMAGYRP